MVESELIYGSIVLYIAGTLAAGGGIGGGGLNVPIFLVLFDYSYDRAGIFSCFFLL